ncbi:hypothetical protein Goari_009097, partial [Gossypium aridum]|nr:hypothetical protein [Gossypium aridum]
IVKGDVDPASLVDYVYKRTSKQVSIVKDEENMEEAKKKNTQERGKKKMSDIKRSEYHTSKYYS